MFLSSIPRNLTRVQPNHTNDRRTRRLTWSGCPCANPTCSVDCAKKRPPSSTRACRFSPVQGQLMRMLTGLIGARRAIEIGVFTGYSALSVALALPEDGELVACDVSEEWTAIARRYWSEAGVASKMRLEIAPRGRNAGQAGSRRARRRVRHRLHRCRQDELRTSTTSAASPCCAPVDWSWSTTCSGAGWWPTRPTAPRTPWRCAPSNARLHADTRVEVSMLPVGDGLTIARKLV